MDGSLKDLSNYRMAQAQEMLKAASINCNIGQYKTSLNRSYHKISARRDGNIIYPSVFDD
jgi:hypothetical protein